MTGRELLALASDLFTRAGHPLAVGVTRDVLYRTVTNRAYYAVFTGAVEFLSRIGFVVNNSSTAHAHVQQALNNSGDTAVVGAANRLRTLSAERRRADYHPADPQIGTHGVADQSLILAEAALLALEQVPTAALGPIASAILIWSRAGGSTTVVPKAGNKP
jgi:hypothetical protein